MCWCTPVILALGRLKQEDHRFKGFIASSCLTKQKTVTGQLVLLLLTVITALTPCGGRWKYSRCVEVVITTRLMEPCDVKQVLYLSLPIEGYVEPGYNIYFSKLVYKQDFLENVLILKITYIKYYLLKALKEQNCEVKNPWALVFSKCS